MLTFYDRNVSGKKFQQLYVDQVSPIGKIFSALLRGTVLMRIQTISCGLGRFLHNENLDDF